MFFYHFLKNFILLHMTTPLLTKRKWEKNLTEYLRMVSVNTVTKDLLYGTKSSIKQGIRL